MVNVAITYDLLAKVAGVKPLQKHTPGFKRPVLPHGGSGAAGIGPAAAAAAAAAAAEQASGLSRSRSLGDLLLKHEEQELAAVQQAAEALTQKHKLEARAAPCGRQQAAVEECYRGHQQDPTACHSLVEAYAACSADALGSRLRKGA